MLKVNLGCGPHAIAGWTNYDLEPHPGVIQHDLTKPLPLDSESVLLIRTEHFLEHITLPQGLALLKECRRVLHPQGRIRISVPSLEYLVERYNEADIIDIPDVWQPKTLCQMFNEGMREWGHQFMYDADELCRVLLEAGFSTVVWQQWRKSESFPPEALEIRPFQKEIIVEAM